jgi:hypothetical protein
MNRNTIYIWSCVAVSAVLLPSFIDQAHAACNPPRDVSSCVTVPKETFAQASPALPEAPFLVTYPRMRNSLVLTYFDRGLKSPEAVPGNNKCNPLNVGGCAWVSSVDLTNVAVAKNSAPFLVQFQDGRSLLAPPVPTR